MWPERFGIDLIVAEEADRESEGQEQVKPSESEIVTITREGFDASQAFPFSEPGTSMPIDGPGTLIDAILISDDNGFGVTITIDGRVILSDSFDNLLTYASEMSRISAYQRSSDNNFVFAASDYEFQQSIEVVIEPDDTITVDVQRAELDLVR